MYILSQREIFTILFESVPQVSCFFLSDARDGNIALLVRNLSPNEIILSDTKINVDKNLHIFVQRVFSNFINLSKFSTLMASELTEMSRAKRF